VRPEERERIAVLTGGQRSEGRIEGEFGHRGFRDEGTGNREQGSGIRQFH
jgi:hypothetical protein